MKIFYLLKEDPDETLKRIMKCHRETHEVTAIDLRREKDYGRIVDRIAESDLVISW